MKKAASWPRRLTLPPCSGTDELIKHQNEFVSFKGMTVAAAGQDENGNDVAYLYKYDGSGQDGDDLYFNVTLGENTYTLHR